MYSIRMAGPITRLCTGGQNFQLCHHLGLWEIHIMIIFRNDYLWASPKLLSYWHPTISFGLQTYELLAESTSIWPMELKIKLTYITCWKSCICVFVCLLLVQQHPPHPPTQLARASSLFMRFLDNKRRCTTIGRTPLDEWSAHRRDLYLITYNTHNTPNRHPCPHCDSNPWPQQVSSCRPMP